MATGGGAGAGLGWAGRGAGLSGGNVIWDSLKINPQGASAPALTERCVRGKSKQAVQPSARMCVICHSYVCTCVLPQKQFGSVCKERIEQTLDRLINVVWGVLFRELKNLGAAIILP